MRPLLCSTAACALNSPRQRASSISSCLTTRLLTSITPSAVHHRSSEDEAAPQQLMLYGTHGTANSGPGRISSTPSAFGFGLRCARTGRRPSYHGTGCRPSPAVIVASASSSAPFALLRPVRGAWWRTGDFACQRSQWPWRAGLVYGTRASECLELACTRPAIENGDKGVVWSRKCRILSRFCICRVLAVSDCTVR